MGVLEWWECLNWMDWVSWRVWLLDGGVSGLVAVDEVMVPVELWIVPNSNPFRLMIRHLRIIIHLNWTISLLFNPLLLVMVVSFWLHPSHWLVWLMDWFEFTDLPQLQSVKLVDYAFQYTESFEMSNLPSLQSIDMSGYCFYYAPSFSLTGLIDGLVWIHRSSSTTITYTWLPCIRSCSIGSVWEWLNGWIDDSDLPKLQSIQFAPGALEGDAGDDRKTISTKPYNYKNTLTMRSEIEWVDEWIDLPSLTEFKGNRWNFEYIGSVILESIDVVFDWCRHPSVIIQWNLLRLCMLLLHLFPPILKYPFSHFLIIRCCCSRISHQTQKRVRLIPIPCFFSP